LRPLPAGGTSSNLASRSSRILGSTVFGSICSSGFFECSTGWNSSLTLRAAGRAARAAVRGDGSAAVAGAWTGALSVGGSSGVLATAARPPVGAGDGGAITLV